MQKSTQDRQGKDEQADKMAMAAIEEARMVLPGIQALFGFQLIAAFNQRFQELAESDQIVHFVALLLVCLSIAIIMAPAAYHRLVECGSMSDFFVRLASSLIAIAMLPLMIALCLEVYLLGRVILHQQGLSIAVASLLLIVFTSLWFAFPFAMRLIRERGR
jgi:Family of unknown function (DUF6328)